MKNFFAVSVCLILSMVSCSKEQDIPEKNDAPDLSLPEVARMLASLPLDSRHLGEVYDAVCSSSSNGYDEEYTMRAIMDSPGSGVGDDVDATRAGRYTSPLRDLIRDYLSTRTVTRSGAPDEGRVQNSMSDLASSDIQIYFPFHDSVDAAKMPVITYDPHSEAAANIGYRLLGDGRYEEVVVDEALAMSTPVWVVNNNSDAGYTSLEIMSREHPDWGGGGAVRLKSDESPFRSLMLKNLKMKRHYDSWFRGASEFWIKCGSVEGLSASTEAELKLYQPTVTDFMLVVRRNQLGLAVPVNTILISDWTEQLESFAFMITEDDGGTRTSWKTAAEVKLKSKTYGVSLELPFNQKDDIVWRGSLSTRFFENYSGETAHFGNVDVTFEIR